jgi:hypothetical protein
MPKLIDLTGQRFGKLVALYCAGRAKDRHYHWVCRCDCGKERSFGSQRLRRNHATHCGCSSKRDGNPSHGLSRSPEHKIWCGIRGRCSNPNHSSFPKYGARGITVCERWLKFENFLADMGPRPSSKHSIDRIDPNGNYEPGNCRWASQTEQANNKRNTRLVMYRGEQMPLTDAVREAGSVIHYETAWGRIRQGWPIAAALETPSSKDFSASAGMLEGLC